MFGKFGIIVHDASIRLKQTIVGKTKTFATLTIGGQEHQTSINEKSREEPQWNEMLIFEISEGLIQGMKIDVQIIYKEKVELIGSCVVDVAEMVANSNLIFRKQFSLFSSSNSSQVTGQINVTIKYTAGEQVLTVAKPEQTDNDSKSTNSKQKENNDNKVIDGGQKNQNIYFKRYMNLDNSGEKVLTVSAADNGKDQHQNKLHYSKPSYLQPRMVSQFSNNNKNTQSLADKSQQINRSQPLLTNKQPKIIGGKQNQHIEELLNPKRLKLEGSSSHNKQVESQKHAIKFKYQIPDHILNMKSRQYKKEQLFQNPMRKVPTFGRSKRELQFTPDSQGSNRSFSEGPGFTRHQVKQLSLKEIFYPPKPQYQQQGNSSSTMKNRVLQGISNIMKQYTPQQIKHQINFVPRKLENYLEKIKEKKSRNNSMSQSRVLDDQGTSNQPGIANKLQQQNRKKKSGDASLTSSKYQSRVQSQKSISITKGGQSNNNQAAVAQFQSQNQKLNPISNSYLQIRMKGVSFGKGDRNMYEVQQRIATFKLGHKDVQQDQHKPLQIHGNQHSLSPRRFNDHNSNTIGIKLKSNVN